MACLSVPLQETEQVIHATCCATTLAAYSMERHWSLQGRDMLTSRDSDPPFTSTRELTQILAETLDTSGFPFSQPSSHDDECHETRGCFAS